MSAEKPLEQLLAEIEGRANAAYEGPWNFSCSGDKRRGSVNSKSMTICFYDPNDPVCHTNWKVSNFEFIAHARTDVPRLVKALRLAIEQRDELAGDDSYTTRAGRKELLRLLNSAIAAVLEGK